MLERILDYIRSQFKKFKIMLRVENIHGDGATPKQASSKTLPEAPGQDLNPGQRSRGRGLLTHRPQHLLPRPPHLHNQVLGLLSSNAEDCFLNIIAETYSLF